VVEETADVDADRPEVADVEAEARAEADPDVFMPVSPNTLAAEAYIDVGRRVILPSSYFLSIRSRIISRLMRCRILVSRGASEA
jgi:hypothetical protein